jgi:hypothetical protein
LLRFARRHGGARSMALDTRQAFKFLQINYAYGLLDEVGSIVGDALDRVMQDLDMDMEDVLDRLDGADERTVERLNDAFARWSDIFFKLAANRTVTRLQARLLKVPAVRRAAVRGAASFLRRKLAAPTGARAAEAGASCE